MPIYLIFCQSFPEILILIYLGLVLIDSKPPAARVIVTALAAAILSNFIRTLIPFSGVNAVALLALIVILLVYLCKLPVKLALISTILGFLGVSMGEILFNSVMTWITGVSLGQVMYDPIKRLFFPVPEFVFLTIIILWLRHRQMNIKRMVEPYYLEKNDPKNIRPVLLLCVTVVLVTIAFYCQFYLAGFTSWSKEYVIFILFAVSMLAMLLTVALTWKIVHANHQNTIVEMQKVNIKNLQDMMQIIKAQRHDFINHLQVIYGLLKLGEQKQIEEYITSLYQEIQVTGEILRLAIPELSAFLLVQTGMAASHDISLRIQQESDLDGLAVPSTELVVVVGNLLKNAMEAVTDLPGEQKTVKLKIFERSKYYVVQTQNHGWIPREVKSRIFEAGFTTKTGINERGIGLASVKYQVEKYHGIVLVSSHPQNGTRFTICYPKAKRRRGA